MSLKEFFSPKSVAVVGASHTPSKIGYVIFENFVKGGYSGMVYGVNPNTEPILGKKIYSSILDIPSSIDLAVIAVPAQAVPSILGHCAKKKVKAVVIISGGFSEIGKEGSALEEKCKKIIKRNKMCVLGPNCIGVYDAFSKVDTLFLAPKRLTRPGAGKIAFISQSGAVGSVLLDCLAAEGIGISRFISYGNAIDVNASNLIEYLAKDGKTKVVVSYLEGVKDGREFLKVAKKVSNKKPIIVLKAGKTSKGVKAVSSHTGSLAGVAEIYSGVFKQAGVIEAQNWEELFDIAKALAYQPKLKGKKLAILTNGGGFGVLATDAVEKAGLESPEPSAKLKKIFKKNFPAHAAFKNPIDLTGDADSERYKIALETCLKSKEFDGILLILLFQTPTLEANVIDTVAELNKKYKKPI